MKNFVKIVALALLLSAAWLDAQVLERRQPLPDLVPVDINLGADCRIVVTLRNNGPGIIPNTNFSLTGPGAFSGVQLFSDGALWSGFVLGALDTSFATQPVGGTVNITWPGPALSPGGHVLNVVVDTNNAMAESNELNNSLTKKLACLLPLPDLVPVSFSLQQTGPTPNSPCQIYLTLKNNGLGIVPDAAFLEVSTAPGVQMYNDGAPWGGSVLHIIDPTKVLQPAGATLVNTWSAFNNMGPGAPHLLLTPGQHVLRVDVDPANALVESNEGNNSLTQTVTCGIVVAPPTP